MATASQLLAKLKTLRYSVNDKSFSVSANLIETTYRSSAYALLEDSVSQAAAVGISIMLKGFGNAAPKYSYVQGADIYLPTSPPASYPAMDIMTYFLFETRNAMRAIKVCEIRRKAAQNTITPNSFVYFSAEYEARGGLELGEMWNTLITQGKIAQGNLTYYPSYCYNQLYLLYPNWKTDSTQLSGAIDAVLRSGYSTGGTRRDIYTADYNTYKNNPAYQASYAKATCTGSSLNFP
jgi:hypothetical protein